MLGGMPNHVLPGHTLSVPLSLGTRHAGQSVEELELSLGQLAGSTLVEVSLEEPGVGVQPLYASVTVDVERGCLAVVFTVPAGASAAAHMVLTAIVVAGQQPVAALLPVNIAMCQGMRAPLRLRDASPACYVSPCMSRGSVLFVPPGHGPGVRVFDCAGSESRSIPVVDLGLANSTCWAAYADEETPTLLLADCHSSSRVVAVDPSTRLVRWATDPLETNFGRCLGLAVLPALGYVMLSSLERNGVFFLRLSDGVCIGYKGFTSTGLLVGNFLAVDPVSEDLFCALGSRTCLNYSILALSLSGKSGIRPNQDRLVVVSEAGTEPSNRPLAYMPPAPGKSTSHLIIGCGFRPQLIVLSLPSLTLVHTHMLEGMKVTGLTADPWGGALAVCDAASKDIHVLRWPLPGMPPLK